LTQKKINNHIDYLSPLAHHLILNIMKRHQKEFGPSNKKDKRRQKRLTKHHLIPKERVKLGTVPEDESDRSYSKVLMLWRNRHDYWHYLFGNLTIFRPLF